MPGPPDHGVTPVTVPTALTAEEYVAKLSDIVAKALAQPDMRAHWRAIAADPKRAKRHAKLLRIIRVHFPDVLLDDTTPTEPG